ncbi:MAG: recombination protein RecR [Kiritimatiellae bacterium]|nr:recombination protein RecR [Kiritimatiellia bacterium]
MLAPIEDLVRNLARLPGFGRRSAGRAALALLREPDRLLEPLVLALRTARDSVVCCPRCGAFTVAGQSPCSLCTDPLRDGSLVCVVEDPADIVAIEASGAFKGRYHVLGGKLSPAHHMGPERLRLGALKERIAAEGFTEVLLAVSTDMEGDATAGYVVEFLAGHPSADQPVKVTRLAFGLPADSGVAYSDPLTLRRAIVHRCPQ